MGATILVGQAVGAGQFRDAKQYSFLGVGLALAFSTVAIAILLVFREPIASLYTTDVQIIGLADSVLSSMRRSFNYRMRSKHPSKVHCGAIRMSI